MNGNSNHLAAVVNILQSKYPSKEFSVTKNIEGEDVAAFVHDATSIYDPYTSDCGRFDVSPVEAYGIELEDAQLMAKVNDLTSPAPSEDIDSFKRWFGNSKLVDSEGNPLVVYHGGHFKADEFEGFDSDLTDPENDLGAGFYFTTSKTDAMGYDYNREYDEPQVLSVFISLQNPYVLGESDKIKGFEDESGKEAFRAAIQQQGYDGIIDKTVNTRFADENYHPGEGVWHIVAFHPEQIKSASSKDGSFFKPDVNKPSRKRF